MEDFWFNKLWGWETFLQIGKGFISRWRGEAEVNCKLSEDILLYSRATIIKSVSWNVWWYDCIIRKIKCLFRSVYQLPHACVLADNFIPTKRGSPSISGYFIHPWEDLACIKQDPGQASCFASRKSIFQIYECFVESVRSQ